MATLTKDQEQYIEHEVQLRLHDEKFQNIVRDLDDMKSDIRHLDSKLERALDGMKSDIRHLDSKFDSQFKWIIGMFANSIILPVVLHFIKVV